MNNDWSIYFVPATRAFLSGQNPYTFVPGYASPPWTLGLLAPLVWLPPLLAMALPLLALLYLSIRRRKPYLLALVGLSFPFIAGSVYANIDWLVMLGVAIGGPLGVILDTVKPQAGVFAILAEVSARKKTASRLLLILPLCLLALVSIPLWSGWLHNIVSVGGHQDRSLSLFPYSLPLGIVALYLAWRRKSPLWGCIASLSIAPYWYIHSLMPLLFLVADRNWRAGLALNAASWLLVGLIISGIVPVQL